ncbi:MAG: SAM-dependent methyltransferase [Bacteroidetes bacterium]|nr:SAM-dependent methyltransferase [Bacteroidota bacterium]
MSQTAIVYLIPTWIDASAPETIPPYLLDILIRCQDFFVENERTTRRYFKSIRKDLVIDNYRWIRMDEPNARAHFRRSLKENRIIGIVSEAGCPGIADPGQELVALAQEMKVVVKPLVGPSSLLLALMASGMNGQSFTFHGYLPIDAKARNQAIQALELDSIKHHRTQLFIETPYRNDAMLQALLQQLKSTTRVCLAVDLTAPAESVQTKTVAEWKKSIPVLHKRPMIFLVQAAAS